MRKLLLMAAVMVLTACNQTVQPPVVPNPPIVEPIKTVKINPQLLEACAPLDQLEPRAYTEKEFVTSVIPNMGQRIADDLITRLGM